MSQIVPDTADLHPIDQLFVLDAHYIHRHLASDKLNTLRNCGFHQLFQRGDVASLHHTANHLGACTQHVHTREAKLPASSWHHHSEHAPHEVLLHIHRLGFPKNIQSPEGEEQGNLLAACCSTVCNNEGSDRFIQISAEYDHCSAFRSCEGLGLILQ